MNPLIQRFKGVRAKPVIMSAEEQANLPRMKRKSLQKVSAKKMEKTMQFMAKVHQPYYAEHCNESLVIKSKFGFFKNKESEFDPKELWFIPAVKNAIINNGLHYQIDEKFSFSGSGKDIKYFDYNKSLRPGDVFSDCMEVDLSAAYFETARMMNLITDKLYDRCINPSPPHKPISKKVRLAAIGSLARKRHIVYFDGYKQHELGVKREEETEFIWDLIANYVAKLMTNTSNQYGDAFLIFWVDALFVVGSNVKQIEVAFANAGFRFSSFPVKKLQVTESKIIVDGKEVQRKDRITGKPYKTTIREFPYSQPLTTTEIMQIASTE